MKHITIYALIALTINIFPIMAQDKIKQTAGRDQLGEFAPKFAQLNDDILFGEVWSRTEELSLRDRSLVTLTSLISQGLTDSSLAYHLQSARQIGITRARTSGGTGRPTKSSATISNFPTRKEHDSAPSSWLF